MSTDRRSFALRGATTVEADVKEEIVAATAELLGEMLARNGLRGADVVSIIFTSTPDLVAAFPAVAARSLGLTDVPLLCASEIEVPDALPRCVRVLMHLWAARPEPPRPVYLRGARSLRADLTAE